VTTPEEPGQPGTPEPTPPGYGTPPPDYGTPQPPQPPYGAPAQPPYAAPPPAYGTPPPGYGAPQYGGAPGTPGAPGGQLADWGSRVVGGLIDYFIPGIIVSFFYRVSAGLGILLGLASLAWIIYNKVIEGQTGQSIGKRVAGTRLVRERDLGLVGPGLAIGRWLLHILDGIPCYLGYLWPLWDGKKQTFADKIVQTIVLKV
jgi:uncharacterized RDD family membrane protein YckC